MKNKLPPPRQKTVPLIGRYIILYVVIIVIISTIAFLEYRDRTKESLNLLQQQADITANLIGFAGIQQIEHSSSLEENLVNRAIDVLSTVGELNSQSQLSETDLSAFIKKSFIHSLFIYDSLGQILAKTEAAPNENQGRFRGMGGGGFGRGMGGGGFRNHDFAPPWVLDFIDSPGDTLILGLPGTPFRNQNAISEQRFAVGLKMANKIIVICQLTTEAEKSLDASGSLKLLLDEMVHIQGIAYIKIIDSNKESISARNENVRTDDFSDDQLEAMPHDILWRKTATEKFIEIHKILNSKGQDYALVIGFQTHQLDETQRSILSQLIMRTIVATIIIILILSMSVSKRDKTLLEREKKRIEGDVRRLENLHRVQEKQAALGELAAGVAHEIRNPLNAISILAQRLKKEFKPDQNHELFETATQTMISEIKRIDQILRNFLDYARPTPIKPSVFDLRDLFAEIKALFFEQSKQKNIEFIVKSESISIGADRNYLQQALINLIKNAMEAYTADDSIELSATLKRTHVNIVVSDSGKGIPKEVQNRIFDLFYTTKEEGTGVGLAITHKIITDHQGTIELDSSPEMGTKFILTLPEKLT